MLFQNLSNPDAIDVGIIICHIVVLATAFIVSAFLFTRLKGKSKDTKGYLTAITLFFLCYGIGQGVMAVFEITFDPFIWRINIEEFNALFRENPDLGLRYDIAWRLQQAFGSVGVIALMYQMEKRLLNKKTKYLFTWIKIGTAVIAVMFGVSKKDEITIINVIAYIGNAMVVIIPLIYLYFAIITTGETRKRSIGAAMGILILYAGVVMNSSIGKGLLYAGWGIAGLQFTYVLFAGFITLGSLIYLKSIKY